MDGFHASGPYVSARISRVFEDSALRIRDRRESSPRAVAVASKSGRAAEPQGAATPLVRALAKQHGIDLSTVTGTGAGGRIRTRDVMNATRARGAAQPRSRAVDDTAYPSHWNTDPVGDVDDSIDIAPRTAGAGTAYPADWKLD